MTSISYSRRDALRRCPRKYFLTYVKKLRPVETPAPLRMGQAFSDALEEWSTDPVNTLYEQWLFDAPSSEPLLVERAKVLVMAEAYMNKYDQPQYREVEFEREVDGFSDNGRFDGVDLSGPGNSVMLIEDKLKGRWMPADQIAVETLDDQVTAYLVNASIKFDTPIEDVEMLYRVTLKPAHRFNRQKESIGEYQSRISEAVQKDKKRYLQEVLVHRTEHQAREWQAELEETIAYLSWLDERGTWRRQTNACADFGGCSLLPICSAANEDEIQLALQGFTKGE